MSGPPMQIRDADLRQAIHCHGAGPGTDLWHLLRELQERRDAADAEGGTETGRETTSRRSTGSF